MPQYFNHTGINIQLLINFSRKPWVLNEQNKILFRDSFM